MTLFSKIIRREIPAEIVYEDDLCIAFKDIRPVAPVHVLLIPKKEIPSLAETSAADAPVLGHLLAKAREVAEKLGIDQTGFRTVINTRDDAGQEVAHLHLHLIGGRKMSWPPG